MKIRTTKQLVYSLIVAVLMSVPHIGKASKANTQLSKTIDKRFKCSDQTIVDISNKYGNIIFNTWDKDSVHIKIVATASAKNSDVREKTLKRIDFEFAQQENEIIARTTIDNSHGIIKDFWYSLMDFSKAVLSVEHINVEYIIHAPKHTNIRITNKFGDVFLDEFESSTRIEVANGNLKTGNLVGNTHITLRFSDGEIGSLQHAIIDMKSSELALKEANNLDLTSNTSKMFLGKMRHLKIDSRADKVEIMEIDSIYGKGSFSKIRIRQLNGGTKLNLNFGSLKVSQLSHGFSVLDVVGKSTDIDVFMDSRISISTTLRAKVGKLHLPIDNDLKQVYTDDREKFIHASGKLGSNNGQKSEMVIDAQGGSISIDYINEE